MDPIEERIAEKISIENECWNWTGGCVKKGTGKLYGKVWINGRNRLVHRVMYEILIGEIPAGLTLDHLCRNTLCCNPFHCEPVSMRENVLRGSGIAAKNALKTECIRGHPLSGENLQIRANGTRQCRACMRLYYWTKKGVASPSGTVPMPGKESHSYS